MTKNLLSFLCLSISIIVSAQTSDTPNDIFEDKIPLFIYDKNNNRVYKVEATTKDIGNKDVDIRSSSFFYMEEKMTIEDDAKCTISYSITTHLEKGERSGKLTLTLHGSEFHSANYEIKEEYIEKLNSNIRKLIDFAAKTKTINKEQIIIWLQELLTN